ncbi:MAG: molybdopterin-dependent oxidoreductase [Armatimonadetes bacterium]|nr:molybdopterin-dependent oxidoreductase [Armatimonadota bacterium]
MDLLDRQISRRAFLKASGSGMAAFAVAPRLKGPPLAEWEKQTGRQGSRPDPTDEDVKIVRSVCLMCHGGCGIQCKVKGGELIKIDGNPYHPNTYDYTAKGDLVEESDLDAGPAGKDLGSVCPKGQAGIYALYNPARLTHPLKRIGPRGSGKWKTISWDQALKEICEGGLLFKDVPGEENRQVEGLKSILTNENPMGPEDSDYMDEAPPEGFGPKLNQFVWSHGRNEQSPLTPRFVKNACGVPHMLNHCDRCAGTFYNTIEEVLNLPEYEIGAYADYEYCTYLMSFGSNITAADYPMQVRTRFLQKWAKRGGPHAGEFKHVVIDPRLSNGAAKALHSGQGEWIPLKPTTDAFFLLGMMRWIIENEKHKKDYLSLPNEKAAKAKGCRNWTDMTYLVSTKAPKLYLTGKQAGLGQSDFVVLVKGQPKMFHEVEGAADLDASYTLNDVEYKTVFRMLRERAQEKTLEECEEVCDIQPGTIARIASEFAGATNPVAEFFRGPAQSTNGWGNGRAICILNILMDNIDRKGGFTPGHAPYKSDVGGDKRTPKGVPLDRSKKRYEGKKPTATRPWFPNATRTVTTEWLGGLKQGYPYKTKAYLNYYNGLAYTQPYNETVYETLIDVKALPLFFSIDAYMNETSQLADYVLPDTEYLERYGGFKTYPPILTRVWGLRQPVVGHLDPKTHEYRGIHPDVRMGDDILIDIAIRCGLPAFGKDGGGQGIDIFNSWQFWNEFYKNGDFKGEAGLDPEGRLAKLGGKFENPGKKYDAQDYCRYAGGRPVRALYVYSNKVAALKNSMTGKHFDALPTYRGLFDCKEQPLDPAIWKEHPFQLHTYKHPWHTQSRTAQNLWLMGLAPENYAEINPADAARLGVQTGDWVKAKSPSSKHMPMFNNSLGDGWYKFQIRTTSRIRPGCFSVCNSFGRWGSGARPWQANGKDQYWDKKIGAGFMINPLYMADPVLGNVIFVDPIAGGTQSFGTPLRVERM